MATSPARRRALASSPFKPDPEPVIEEFALDDRISHDRYGLGRVVAVDADGVTVDFNNQILRIPSPFANMSKL
ncbi:MAG: hypothetical protein U0R80_20710 [Nocardioidaceae bacterium]